MIRKKADLDRKNCSVQPRKAVWRRRALPQMRTKDNSSSCRPAELESLEESESLEILAPRPNPVKELRGISCVAKNGKGIVLNPRPAGGGANIAPPPPGFSR